MLLRRPLRTLTLPVVHPHLSTGAAATVEVDQHLDPLSPPFDYLRATHGRPPDTKHDELILVPTRGGQGAQGWAGAGHRLRAGGRQQAPRLRPVEADP
ncbi:hypothetical protein GUJ93_ZPchr0005g15370 [Zizania palustris]|uniref:Uncharacterized protein n=1 Tax=Zizania palustris TaxID=103762 RepID=A0A8J5VQP6_ZIZPA|nr:hypothetical protein GUJ93_ZPchr0005g15370 [Zizania palustris]